MKLSMKWLTDYVNPHVDIATFCSKMTFSGSKVECYETEGNAVEGVVVGRILSITPHTDSDHLSICMVDVGGDAPLQIVTGANNIRENALVPVAMIGANLPNGVHIKKGKLRGVESSGMLCSLGELGLTRHDFPYAIEDGIFLIEEDCTVGEDIHTALGYDDTTVEFEITSNRPDCLSVTGLAREASVTFNTPLTIPDPTFTGCAYPIRDNLSVSVENPDGCPRYIAGMVRDVKIAPSPRWMRERLRASGVRPINNLVDITNYVMLEFGQPMHAFDARYVAGNHIIVRNATNDEEITTLDGQKRTLQNDMLIIADNEKPIAVAGVMGGEYSGIMDDTTTVIFESAYFEPTRVRRASKRLGLRTDASSRYEKGLDPDNCERTLRRAMQLVEELGAGTPVGDFIEVDNRTHTTRTIPFDPDWINSFLGTDIPRDTMVSILESLEITVDGDKCIPPSFRVDLERNADIAEEIARIYDYNNIPSTVIRGVAQGSLTADQKLMRSLEQTTAALGYYGTLNFSFTSPKCFDRLGLPADSPLRRAVTIKNPLGEDTSIMRTTTLPSMLDSLATNYKNRNATAWLYEVGKEYVFTSENSLPLEPTRLTLGAYGDGIDFFTMKGTIESIAAALHLPTLTLRRPCDVPDAPADTCALHRGRSAIIYANETIIGFFGQVHPAVQKNYGIGEATFLAKLLPEAIAPFAAAPVTYRPLPKFPAITRDLSVVCAEDIPVGTLTDTITAAGGELLEDVALFDVYHGDQIAKGNKSVSFSLRLRSHDATLTDTQADAVVTHVLKKLSAIGASLRQ